MKRLFLKGVGFLLVMLSLQVQVIAQENTFTEDMTDSDRGYFQSMARKSRLLGFENIFNKWQEVKESLKDSGPEGKAGQIYNQLEHYIESESDVDLKIFISRSMGSELIKRYALEAKKYGGVLVLRGLPDESWQSLSSLVLSVADIAGIDNLDDLGLTIDDEAFQRYAITGVPSFVLTKKDSELDVFSDKALKLYDKISGNIGIRRALEEMAEFGELAEFARALLPNNSEV